MHNHVSLLQSRKTRSETSRHHSVLDLDKVKPLFEINMRRNSQFGVCFAVATSSHWCCLTHNMPPSAPTKQRWLRTSLPRVFEDTSTGKWRLRLLYEYVASVASFVERKLCVFPLQECTRTCLSISYYVQHTNSYVHTYLVIRRLRSLNALF